MPASIWKVLNKNSPGTSTTFGADDWDMPGRYHNDIDLSATASSSIKTNTRYWDNRLRVWNPAKTFSYNIRSLALTANRDVTLPLLTSNDEFVMLLHSQTVQNKIMNLANNTFTSTGATTGGIPKHDGTKYLNIARGSAGQVPTVNVGGTDWTWADPSASTVSDNAITTTKIANAAVTNAKLATNAVSGTNIVDASVTDAKLAQITDTTKLPAGLFFNNPMERNIGWMNTSHETAHNGIFNGVCVATGTFSRVLGSTGIVSRYTTGATSGNQAGFRTNVSMTRRNHNFSLKGSFKLTDATNTRMFIGLVDDTAAFRSGTAPNTDKTAIGIWCNTSGGANFEISSNDGAGGHTATQWSTPTAIDTTSHTFEIKANDTSANFQINIDALGTTTLSSNIPGTTTNMALQAYIETATAATKAFSLGYLILDAPAGNAF